MQLKLEKIWKAKEPSHRKPNPKMPLKWKNAIERYRKP